MKALERLFEIDSLVTSHEEWRQKCLNLVAAESRCSDAVRAYLSGDLSQRYADYTGRDLDARKYQGVRYIKQIEHLALELAQSLFGARFAELRPTSGHVAGNGVIMSLTKPGDTVFEMGSDGGGHRLATKLTTSPLVQLDVRFLPIDPCAYNIDTPRAVDIIRQTRPRLVILGSSNFLFPHPVREIAEVVHESPGAVLAYDASHVLGLIAGGRFQRPLEEGADVLFGSTHKTFPAPNGGLILTNSEAIIERIGHTVYPALLSNHHLSRMPGLAVAMLEVEEYGQAYADQIVANAQALGQALHGLGIPVVGAHLGYTQSHTLLLQVSQFGTSAEVADSLEECNIIVTRVTLPVELGIHGVRLGVQELTRLGAKASTMREIASLIAQVLHRQVSAKEARKRAVALASQHQSVEFCFKTW